jgi:hypothetical protein
MRTSIVISKQHKLKEGLYFNWSHVVNGSNFEFIGASGYNFVATERDYYFAKSSDRKIHYHTMGAKNSSAEWYKDFYVEIEDGVYTYAFIATNDSVSEKIEACVTRYNALLLQHPSIRGDIKSRMQFIDNKNPPTLADLIHNA